VQIFLKVSNYLEITLIPRGRFFFGQEIVFGGGPGADERRRSYLVHSGLLPQQTSLLGALRETILRQHGALLPRQASSQERERAANLVGPESFSPTAGNGNYGVIAGLSPLVIRDDHGRSWYPAPTDDRKGKDGKTVNWELSKTTNGETVGNLVNLDPKAGSTLCFSDGNKLKPLDSFFREQSRVGVRTTNRHGWRTDQHGEDEDDQEGFYRQTFRNNRKSAYANAIADAGVADSEFRLVFRVAIDSTNQTDFAGIKNDLITLGGERSTFQLTVEEVTDGTGLAGLIPSIAYLEHTAQLPAGYARIALLSDAYLDLESVKEMGGFVVGEPQPFRYFSTNLKKTSNFFYLGYDKDRSTYHSAGRWQSRKHTLLRRGSIIIAPTGPGTAPATFSAPASAPTLPKNIPYDSSVGAITNHIHSQAAFRTIGYNYYKILS
jgi:CRISPR-associated protein Cmr3